jgi:signal transduction histidine kinase
LIVMELLRPRRRVLVGLLVGAVASLLATLLAWWAGESLLFVGLLLLAVAVVGLGLGATAAAYAYVSAAVVIVVLTLLPREASDIGVGDAVRLAAFVLGAPVVVLMALQAERGRQQTARERDRSDLAERQAQDQRDAADDARRELNKALGRAERERARLEEVAEAIPEPLIVYDAELRGTYGNRATLRLLGRSFFERPIEEWGRIADPRDEHGQPLPREDWPQLRAQTEPYRGRLTVRVPLSGRDLLVNVEGTPIRGGGCVLLLRDVGKEEDERRRLSRFASFVAHELRNPLAVAKARIELARRDEGMAGRAAAHADRAHDSVDAAIAILERLELFSRADAGRLEARRERFELRPAIAASLERLRARGCEREVTIAMRGRPWVIGDQHLAEQAITNLLTNADRYSIPEGPIRIEVSGGDPVILRVVDAGPGIADDVAQLLFRDRVSSGRGLGLGLYLVNAMMQAQGGSARLEQRNPRAVFALRWKRASGAPSRSSAASASEASAPVER